MAGRNVVIFLSIIAAEAGIVFWIEKKEPVFSFNKKIYGILLGIGNFLLILLAYYREQAGGYTAIWYFGLWTWLFCLSFYDLKYRELPDVWHLLLIVFYIVFWMLDSNPVEWKSSLLTVIILAAILGLIYLVKKDAIGLGDIKLILLCGVYTGTICMDILVKGLIAAFFCGLFLLLFRKVNMKSELPFVPFLFLGALIL